MKLEHAFGFEKAGWAALVVDKRGIVVGCNATAAQTFGSALQGGSARLEQIWSPENEMGAGAFLEHWQKQPASSSALKFNVRGLQVSYTTVVCGVEHEGASYFVFQLFPDLGGGIGASEKRAEGPARGIEETIQKNKLDVALQLARSVALDFNNALAGVMGHSSLLLHQMPLDHPWRKSLQEIEKAAERGAEIANSLRTFTRSEKDAKAPGGGNLNLLLERVVDRLRSGPPGNQLKWQLNLEPRLFLARFDEPKMELAFGKVLENALQAVSIGGAITISTRNLDITSPTQDRNARLAPGAYVCTEIADTGCGIETALLPRIFEPFFTTKEKNKHRGLGLAWAYGVITNHGGGIAVSSKVGVGTSVRIYLPAEKKVVADKADPEALQGSETILVVDDEAMVLNVTQTVLETYGYKVVTASSGKAAMKLISQPGFKADLLVTDLAMPGMSGPELAEAARSANPNLPVLFVSGALGPEHEANATGLQKPFTSDALISSVRSKLNAATKPG